MAYSKINWENLPQKTTPLSAQNLNHMDEGIADLDTRVTTIEQQGGGSGSGGVGVRSKVGTNNELFNDTASHTIENVDSKNNHLEGSTNTLKKTNQSYDNDANHLEGKDNISGGYAGHVENSSNQVHETNAHAGGKHSVASGSGAFAQGRGVISFGTATFSTGQSAKGGDSNVTTLVDAEIDWATQTDEDETGRAQRIAAKLIDLWHNDTNFKGQFTAAIGGGAMAGGINTFVNGGGSFGHGFECEVTAQNGFVGGYQAKTLANGGFTWGVDAQTLAPHGITFGISTRNRGEANLLIGNYCESAAAAKYSFAGGDHSYVEAINSLSFGLGCYASAPQSTALGSYIIVGTENQTGVGIYNNNNSSALFVVGNGTSSARSNAFEVFSDYVLSNVPIVFTNSIRGSSCGNKANNTIVMGSNTANTASADNSFTGGQGSESQAKNAFTFGVNCYAAAEGSAAFGQGIVIGTPYQFAVGKYNDNSSTALFVVGNGTSSARKNAFEVFSDYITINGTKFTGKNVVITEDNGDIQIEDGARIVSASGYTALTLNTISATLKDISGYGITLNGGSVDITQSGTIKYTLFNSNNKVPTWSKGNLITDLDILYDKIAAKQNKPAVVIPEGAAGNITLSDNTEYLLNGVAAASTAITLTLPSIDVTKGYNSYFVFKSGETAATLTVSFDGTLKFMGDGCTDGVFTPAANKVYEVALKCVGINSEGGPYVVARVGACG